MAGATIPDVGKTKDGKPIRRARYRADGSERVAKLYRLRPDIAERVKSRAARRGITENALLEEVLIAAGFGKPEPEPEKET